MKAAVIVPGSPGVRVVERPEPSISATHDVKLRVLCVGICGTDREESAGGRATAPEGRTELVIGHEMLGQVVAVGAAVTRVAIGDHAVFTVRRGCGVCLPCLMHRADMCRTGNYRERGIKGLDGCHAEFVVDTEQHVVRVPRQLAAVGVLIEPLSIVEKAIAEAERIQFARCPDAATTPDWFFGRRCLVAGLGPVGLLAAMVLSLRGADVYGLDVVDDDNARPRWLRRLGGRYIDGRRVPVDHVDDTVGAMDVVIEAAGVAALEFNLLDTLALNGICVLTGIPGGDRPLRIDGADIVRHLVLGNQLMLGSVNASRGHFQMAVRDLAAADARWPGHLPALIGHFPLGQLAERLARADPGTIKEVIDWGESV